MLRSSSFRVRVGGIGLALITAMLGVVASGAPGAAPAGASGTAIYDSTVSPLPGNLPSLGYEATQTSQFGDQVSLSGAANDLNNVVVTMSSWGCQNGGWGQAYGSANACVTTPGATFSEPVTLNIYSVGANNAVGGLLATDTQTFAIPYRPSASDPSVYSAEGCSATNGKWYNASDNTCNNGLATNITFNLAAQNVVLPSKVIYGIAYNTSDYGASPYGDSTACHASVSGCGYDSLNVGLTQDPTNVSVGSDPNPGTVYWNTQTAGDYCDNGAGGTGTFRIDGNANTAACWDGGANTGWAVSGSGSPYYVPAVQFNATAGPSSTVVVTPPNLVSGSPTTGQFVVTNEAAGGGGSVSIVNGPAGGPSAGSLQMSLSGTSDHWDAFNYDHQGVALSSISTLSYSAYTNNAPDYDPGFQLTANLSPSLTFATVNYEPYEQTTPDTANTWQSYNVLTGVVWATHIPSNSPGGIDDPISWSSFLSLYPGATVLGVGADVGGNWPAMSGNVDAISFGTDGAGGATTTYDFSPNVAPVVTTQPLSQNYTSGSTVTLTAAASGTPTPTVQWQYSINSGSTWANLGGATTTTITEGPMTALENHWQLRAVFTNSAGTANSNAATMTLVSATAPVVTTQPLSQSYTSGSTLTFTAAASGTPTPTVQWQYSLNNGSTWSNLGGATTTTITEGPMTALENHWQLRAVFTNSAGTANSHAATVTET
jgi:hypothetical protein